MSQLTYNFVFAVVLAIGLGMLHLNGVSLLTSRSAGEFWKQDEFRTARNFLIASIVACTLAIYSFYLGVAVSLLLFFFYTALSIRRR
jgi:hypothetical protein